MAGDERMKHLEPETTDRFDSLGRFILPDFQNARAFSSFLPGIAGTLGVPLWVFYVNRGQVMAGFGVESKDHPILEFQPANKAYQMTAALGFRTFLRFDQDYYEPFSGRPSEGVRRTMFTGLNEVEIREIHPGLGLETSVLYFVLPGQPFAALVRQVTFRNVGQRPLGFEILDGLPAVISYGVGNSALKEIGRTIEAWMEVSHIESWIPFYKLDASAGDTAEVQSIEAGNFALAFSGSKLLPVIADSAIIFGVDTAFTYPERFITSGLDYVLHQPQICEGRTPCAFFGARLSLEPGQLQTLTSLYGCVTSYQVIEAHASRIASAGFIDAALEEARKLAGDLTGPIATQTASPLFDAYCRQTFLDNLMRGGWPLILGGRHVYHVFSRKHGDMERDYNWFVLAAEYYSQGNGNYRDVNQNRRSDVFFQPRVADFNLRLFASLIQADGYNPLVVQGTEFSVPESRRAGILAQVERPAVLHELLSAPFTPGKLLYVAGLCGLRLPPEDFLELTLEQADQQIRADFGEGYWIDHWTYLLDQIEAYLAIYPDKKAELLFDSLPIPFYDSSTLVQPRSRRYVLANGGPRQLNALYKDPEKASLIASRSQEAHWARADSGMGEIFGLGLFAKLSLLAVLKFASRDPFGMGIEMEAGRPGWYDALNGLPGLFGSSMPEVFELLRLVDFLLESLQQTPRHTSLPVEAHRLIEEIIAQISTSPDPFSLWERLSDAREAYRESIRLGFRGELVEITAPAMAEILEKMKASLNSGIERALALNDGFPPTYFACQPLEYDVLDATDSDRRPFIRVKSFQPDVLPVFLEGPVRRMKSLSRSEALALHLKLRSGPLFDAKLKMYRVNASLHDQPHDIGRARAFSPGWLENESIWLHMSYKYLLELLKAGLYEQFYADLPTNLVPFMDPAIYGRSPLENSSFIVSSAHPDRSLHGAGFVARLSGSTAEFLSIWTLMMAGPQPFIYTDGALQLCLQPALPDWFFPDDGCLTFTFLGSIPVTYHNPEKLPTWQSRVTEYTLTLVEGEVVTINGSTVPAPYAAMIRDGQVKEIVGRIEPLD
jgi:hypothetical protein